MLRIAYIKGMRLRRFVVCLARAVALALMLRYATLSRCFLRFAYMLHIYRVGVVSVMISYAAFVTLLLAKEVTHSMVKYSVSHVCIGPCLSLASR